MKMKIAYIAEGLYNSAGMERVLTTRINAMCNDIDITFITLDDGSKPDCFPLDKGINRVYLNTKNKIECETALTKYLNENHFDITVSTGGMEFFCLYKIKDGSKKIFEFHFSFDISKVWMAQTMSGMKLWLASRLQTLKRVWIARKYDQIVVLCKADCKKWRRYCNNVTYIYNPLTISPNSTSDCTNKKVIAVGRLHPQKGFDYLISAWKLVAEKHPDWELNIYGEGVLREKLEQQINSLSLSDKVILRGNTNQIVDKYIESSIFVLSSRAEGFPLVLLEASCCGLNLVSFDCPSGPKEIIINGKNGYVIKLGDIRSMAEKICFLIENDDIRKEFGRYSVSASKKYSKENIINQWFNLYNHMISVK